MLDQVVYYNIFHCRYRCEDTTFATFSLLRISGVFVMLVTEKIVT